MPSADRTLWRYMDLPRYIGLLSRGLFFATPSTLRQIDPWEGCWDQAEFDRRQAEVQGLSAIEAQARWDLGADQQIRDLDRFGVTCWHHSEHESAALWSHYVARGMGVAIRTSETRLRAAMAAVSERFTLVDVDYSGSTNQAPAQLEWADLCRKRKAFAFEQEVRGILSLSVDEQTCIRVCGTSRGQHATRTMHTGPPTFVPLHSSDRIEQDPTALDRSTDAGAFVSANIDTLVEAVLLPPRVDAPTLLAVYAATYRFGHSYKLIRSSELDTPPLHRVSFRDW